MVSGLIDIMIWWVIILVIGLAAWPLSQRFFRTFPDKGYILSKGLGLSLVCFINWFLCSLHILPFSFLSVLASLIIMGASGWILLRSEPLSTFKTFLMSSRRLVITTELLFLGAFIFFGIIRMCNADISQTEKMPDFAFLTGILNSKYFPPKDPWYVGETINYFYYGHYQIAMLTKLSGLAPEYTYNLGVAFLFAITLIMATGISYGLINRLKYGILGGLFVAFIGNLDGINQLIANLPAIFSGEKQFYPFTWFNWWMSSRVIVREGIDVTINEFPFWSYILGDLHAHMNVVPFSLLVLAVILEFFRLSGDGFTLLGKGREKVFRLVIAAIALGAIPAANTWDTPTYMSLMVAGLVLGRQFFLRLQNTQKIPSDEPISIGKWVVSPITEIIASFWKRKTSESDPLISRPLWYPMLQSWVAAGMVIALAIILFLPYTLNFHPAGVKDVCVVSSVQWTLAGDFLTIYGFPFFCMMSFIGVLLYPKYKTLPTRIQPIVLFGYLSMFIFCFILFERFMIALCILLVILILQIPLKLSDEFIREKFFALALFLVVLAILLGCEFFYIKDAYGKSLERQNTIFKFYYQAWIFCGIASAYAVYWIRERTVKTISLLWEPAFRLLFVCTLAFPIFGTAVKCNHFAGFKGDNPWSAITMDGTYYMSWQHKGDYEAIRYLREHANPKEDVVVEATGPAFSHYGRISAATGLSTILGWANHENIWRDGTWQKVNERVQDVKEIYTSSDIDAVKRLLDKYQVDYVYVGKLEHDQYPSGDFDKFNTFLEKLIDVKEADGKPGYLYRHSGK